MIFEESSLSHTTWECKYHIVFEQKFKRKVIYGKIKKNIGIILRLVCERKECAYEKPPIELAVFDSYYLS